MTKLPNSKFRQSKSRLTGGLQFCGALVKIAAMACLALLVASCNESGPESEIVIDTGGGPVILSDVGIPNMSITVSSSVVSEGGDVEFEVHSTQPVPFDFDVFITVATEGEYFAQDYSDPIELNIKKGDSSVRFVVPTLENNKQQADGSVTVAIVPNENYGDGLVLSVTAEILNNDNTAELSIAPVASTVIEGEDAEFTISSTVELLEDLVVSLNVSETGNIVKLLESPVIAVLPAGETSTTFAVATNDDLKIAGESTVIAALNSDNAYLVANAPGSRAEVVVRDNDEIPTVSIEPVAAVIDEGDPALFRVSTPRGTLAHVALSVAVSESGEVIERPLTTQFELSNNKTSAMFEVNTDDDRTTERDGIIIMTLQKGAGYILAAAPNHRAQVDVRDNDVVPTVTVAAVNASVAEGDKAVFAVELANSQVANGDITVGIEVEATEGILAGQPATSVVIPDGEASATLEVATLDDLLNKADGSVTVTLNDGTDYVVGESPANSATVAVTDNDSSPQLSIAAVATPILENAGNAVFRVNSSIALLTNRTVNFAVLQEGNYVAGSPPESVELAAGQTSVDIAIPIQDDTVVLDDGKITVTLEAGTGYAVAAPPGNSAAVVVQNDDELVQLSIAAVGGQTASVVEGADAVFTITASANVAANLTVNVSVTEQGSFIAGAAPTAVVILQGADTVSLTVATDNDQVVESAGSITATLASGGYTIAAAPANEAVIAVTDNEPTISIAAVGGQTASVVEGTDAVFTITASANADADLTVNVTVTEQGSFIAETAPTEAVILKDTDTVSLMVTTDNDQVVESAGSITATLASGGYTIAAAPANEAVIAVTDNEPTISIAAVGGQTASVVEGTDAVFTITASADADAELRVNVTVTEQGSFIKGTAPTHAVIAAGADTASLTVVTDDDGDVESTGSITAAIAAGGYNIAASPNNSASVAVADNEFVVSIAAGTSPIEETETQLDSVIKAKARFTITSTLEAVNDLPINVRVQETGSFLAGTAPTSVTLPAGESTVSLELEIEDDEINEAAGRITVTLQSGSNYTVSATAGADTAYVEVEDDDQIYLIPRVYGSYSSFYDSMGRGPWKGDPYFGSAFEGQPIVIYFNVARLTGGSLQQVFDGPPGADSYTAERDLTVNFMVSDTGNKLVRSAIPSTLTLKAGEFRVNSPLLPTICETIVENEPDSQVTVTLNSGDGYKILSNHPTGAGSIGDLGVNVNPDFVNCPADRKISISAVSANIVEGGNVQFTISDDEYENGVFVAVTVRVANGTGNFLAAADAKDYVIPAGQTMTPEIPTRDGSQAGTITATVVAGTGYAAGTTSVATVNVAAQSSSPSVLGVQAFAHANQISIAPVAGEIGEGEHAQFAISNDNHGAGVYVAVTIRIANATGNYLAAANARVYTIAAGNSLSPLIPTVDNEADEPDGVITATVLPGVDYAVGTTGVARVNVLDNDEDSATLARSAVLHREVLPDLVRITSIQTVDTVSDRIEFAFSSPNQPKFAMGGLSRLNDVIVSSGQMLNNADMDIGDLLDGSSFALPLGLQEGTVTNATIWGSGFTQDVSDGSGGELVDWNGEVFVGHLGLDARMGEGLLTGVSATLSDSTVNFNLADNGSVEGLYRVRMTSMHPYLAWSSEDLSTQFRGSLGYGVGEVAIDYEDYGADVTDSKVYSASIGGSSLLYSSDSLFGGGLSKLTVDAEAWTASQTVDANKRSIAGASVDTRSLRVAMEGSLTKTLQYGSTVTPAVAIGTRWDGGASESALGIEITGKAAYENPVGLNIAGLSRMRFSSSASAPEEGVKGELNYDSNSDGAGIVASFVPAWGVLNESAVQQLWDVGIAANGVGESAADSGAMFEAEIGYGFEAIDSRTMLTPFMKAEMHAGGDNEFGIGSSLSVGDNSSIEIEGARATLASGAKDHKLKVEGSLEW